MCAKSKFLSQCFWALKQKIHGNQYNAISGKSNATEPEKDIAGLQSIARKLITNGQLQPDDIAYFTEKAGFTEKNSFLALLISHPLLSTNASATDVPNRQRVISLCSEALLSISDKLEDRFTFFVINDMDDSLLAAIVAWNSDGKLEMEDDYVRLEDCSNDILLRISEKTGEDLKLAIGAVREDIQYIHYSYSRAYGILQQILNKQNIYISSEIDREIHSESIKQKIIQIDMQFLCCLVSRRFSDAMKLVLECLDLEANEMAYSITVLCQFAEEKFNTLMRAMGLSDDNTYGLGQDFWRKTIKKINRSESYDELRDNLDAAMESIISDYREIPKEHVKIERYINYITKNYTDPNLNAHMVCYEFNIAPSSLSRMFKRETGMGVLEYIHVRRLGHVKKLLETDMKIDDIALESGYHTRRGLDTVFKRSFGISPSEYRTAIQESK